MTLEEITDEGIMEVEVNFPRVLTTDETTRLLDYISSEESIIAEYVIQQAITSGKLWLQKDDTRRWCTGKRPAGIHGDFHLFEQPEITVLFDCEMESTVEGLRYKNIKFGIPSKKYLSEELREDKMRIMDKVSLLTHKFFRTYF